MTDLNEYFNKISKLDDQTAIEIGLRKLDNPDKREIFTTFVKQCDQSRNLVKIDLAKEHVDRITSFANLHTDPRPEPGTVREPKIEKHEVEAMISRGEKIGQTLKYVTPESHREELIKIGYEQTRQFEKEKLGRLDKSQTKDKRKLVENLLTLGIDHAYDGVTRGNEHSDRDGRSLKDEFDRHR